MANRRERIKKSLNSIISFRIVILSGIICFCFIAILVRLFMIQIVSHEDYVEKKNDYTSIKQYVSAPRGQIFDRNGNCLAKTVVSHNITYTSPQHMSTDDYLLYANRVIEVFGLDIDTLTERDYKEAFITYRTLYFSMDSEKYAADDLLTQKERDEYYGGAWGSNADVIRYGLLYNRIGEKQLKELDEDTLRVCVIYQRMVSNAASGQENVILEDVDDSDVSYLVEHKTEFPGFEVDFGGWKREYPYGETLFDILGSVSSSTEGLPASYYDYYIQKGFQLNACVGKSGLEYYYNDLLAGTTEESIITYDSNGLAQKEVIREAVKGYDIYLTVDIEMQQALDQVIAAVLSEYGGTPNRENFQSLFMCMMKPDTGEILASSGYQMDLDTRKLTYYSSGTYTSLVNPGSSIKGATVYMGLSEGVVQPGEVINDVVMNIAGEEFGSYKDHGYVDDIMALSVSSNVYMFNIAIRLAKGLYTPGEPLLLGRDVGSTLDLMRSYYTMFGLGNKTGLDAPGELDGYQAVSDLAGMLLNYSIGQYDMYTPLQLAQYVGTIAEDGIMYKPHFYAYAKEVNSEEIVESNPITVRSKLPDKNLDYLHRVQEGFKSVVSAGNAGVVLQEFPYPIAGKTGTAEVDDWTTAIFVGYTPADNPSIAFACAAPTSSVNSQTVSANICTANIVGPVLAKYFELYPQ